MAARTTFPRVSGGIVLDSFSIASFLTGLLAALPAGLILLVGSVGPRSPGVASVVSIVWGLTVLVFVSRFAQLGIAGDEEGWLFSNTAGPWSGTLLAAARLLVLWAVWALPFVAWALLKGEPQAPAGISQLGVASLIPRFPLLLAFWSGAGMILSFAFIAVSAAAPGFGDLFSLDLWKALFPGRIGELFLAVAGTFGPPLAILLVVIPVVVAIAGANPKLALTSIIPFLIYAVGMVLTVQGKLCGAFAAASLAEGAETVEPLAAGAPIEEAGAPAAPQGSVPAPSPMWTQPLGDPKVLYAEWKSRLAAGDAEGAFAAAKELIPAGLGKGEPKLGAEAFRWHLDRLPAMSLDRTALDLLADQLLRDGDVAAAAWTFSQALDVQPSDPKAYKGLLRVAEYHLEKTKEPLEAVRVYRYLLERAPDSPFADHTRDLLADAERRAARPASAQG